jgi:hypothetical protein
MRQARLKGQCPSGGHCPFFIHIIFNSLVFQVPADIFFEALLLFTPNIKKSTPMDSCLLPPIDG